MMSVSYSESSISYKIEFCEKRSLDSGAFSTVFEAQNIADKRVYAVKKIPFQLTDHQKTLKEVDFLIKLSKNSKYIITYFDSWIETNYYIGTDKLSYENGNLLFDPTKKQLLHIQMELYPANLQAIIKSMALKLTEKNYLSLDHYGVSCRLLAQVLEGVQVLHEQTPPIIHRDLKPENIMVSREELSFCIKISDFGLSTYHNFINESKTKYVGTKSYKAPEVDVDGHYNTKADVYSIGRIIEQLFNINLNQELSTNLDKEIYGKYEVLRNLTHNCFSYFYEERPTCKDFMQQQVSWSYSISDSKFNSEVENIIDNKANYADKNHIQSNENIRSNKITDSVDGIAKKIQLWQSEESKFKVSLFWATFQELEKNTNQQNYVIENKLKTILKEYFTDFDSSGNCSVTATLADNYRSTFYSTIEGNIFIQNLRFKNEFILDENLEKSVIGRGTYGNVFKAQHKFDEQTYAVKMQQILLNYDSEKNATRIQRLLRELKVNAVIKYDYLLTYKSFWFESDKLCLNLFIQMELCAMDLKRVVLLAANTKPNIIHLFVVSQLFEEIVKGVSYLHSCSPPIIHRDLKPANILLTHGENGRFIKIADFGFAVFHDTPEMAHTSKVGTAEYTAPEIKSGQYDTKADIFSLGMVLARISNFLDKRNKDDDDFNLFSTKYAALTELKSRMIDHVASNRPTCEEILKNKNRLLSEIEINSNQKFRAIVNKSHNVYDIYQSFFEYFTYERISSLNVTNDTTLIQKLKSLFWRTK